MRVLPTVALSVALAGGLYHPAANADLVGISNSGTIFSIDPETAAATVLGANSALIGPNSLARDGSGTFYTTSGNATSGVSLVAILPATGAIVGTPVALDLRGAPVMITGLAGGPTTGTLYAINDGGSSTPDSLWSIDIASGRGTLVGATGRSSLQGLALSRAGTLYAWDIDEGLQQLDRNTGAASGFATPVPSMLSIQALAFGPNDVLYGTESSLYTINLTSGATSFVAPRPGAGGFANVRGIEYRAPAQVPEPGTLALLVAVLLTWRRARS